jgi:hypothetical protein
LIKERAPRADLREARMSALALATRRFTPLAFRRDVERRLVVALAVVATTLWVVVLPLEIVLKVRYGTGATATLGR